MKPQPEITRSFYRPHKRVFADPFIVNHKTGELVEPPRMVKQSFVDECDINNILKSYRMTGQINHMRRNADSGAYLDLPDELDFQQAHDTITAAKVAFASLPSKVRARFDNDPGEFLAFMSNPANQDEMIFLGLAKDTRPPKELAPEPEKKPISASTGDFVLKD